MSCQRQWRTQSSCERCSNVLQVSRCLLHIVCMTVKAQDEMIARSDILSKHQSARNSSAGLNSSINSIEFPQCVPRAWQWANLIDKHADKAKVCQAVHGAQCGESGLS